MSKLRTLWSEAPWTLCVLVTCVALIGLWDAVHHANQVIITVLSLVVCYFLLKGVRWLWFVMVGLVTIYLVLYLLIVRTLVSFAVEQAIIEFVTLVLLLAPPTRRHFARTDAGASS